MERSGRPPSIWKKSCLTPHSWNFRVDCSKLVGFCSSCLYTTDFRCSPHVYGHRCIYVHATSAEQSSLGCFLHSHWPMTTNPCSRRVDRLVRDNRRRLKRIDCPQQTQKPGMAQTSLSPPCVLSSERVITDSGGSHRIIYEHSELRAHPDRHDRGRGTANRGHT